MRCSTTIANKLLELAKEDGQSLTPMQVLKLVYISHGWFLGIHHRPLISDEVQAWQYGPVIPKLYNKIRKYRSNPVSELIPNGSNCKLETEELDIIKQVYGIYGKLSGMQLSRITHAPGTPWSAMYKPSSFGEVISNDLIEGHYSELAQKKT